MELLIEAYELILKFSYSTDWIPVISALLVLLTLIVLPIWGIDLLVKKFLPPGYKQVSARWDRRIERVKEMVLRIVLPIYIIGLFAIFLLKISAILPWLFWPATALGIVLLAWFYGSPKNRQERG